MSNHVHGPCGMIRGHGQIRAIAGPKPSKFLGNTIDFVTERKICTNWDDIEYNGWHMISTKPKHDWCGMWQTVGCLNSEKHKMLGKGKRVYLKQYVGSCYRLCSTGFPTDLFSFIVGIIMLKIVNSQPLIKRFALSESRRAEKYLTQQLAQQRDIDNLLIKRIFKNIFSVQPQIVNNNTWKITITDYLTNATQFNEPEWKLINRQVYNGFVFLSRHEIVRLIRKRLTVFIEKRINTAKHPPHIPHLSDTW